MTRRRVLLAIFGAGILAVCLLLSLRRDGPVERLEVLRARIWHLNLILHGFYIEYLRFPEKLQELSVFSEEAGLFLRDPYAEEDTPLQYGLIDSGSGGYWLRSRALPYPVTIQWATAPQINNYTPEFEKALKEAGGG